MNKLQQVEAIMDQTLEALRGLGLGGFSLQLHVFSHYESQVWQELATQGYGIYEDNEHPSKDVLELGKDDYADTGKREITIYCPKGYFTTSQAQQQAVTEHAAALAGILDTDPAAGV